MHLIMCGRLPKGLSSTLGWKSPARCKFQLHCVRHRFLIICTRSSGYQLPERVPRGLTLALIFTVWLCFFATRRTSVLLNLSLNRRLVKTLV